MYVYVQCHKPEVLGATAGNFLLYIGKYEGRSESKERFAIKRYLLIIGKKQNMQVLSHTFTYFST
jgi:hypothetical protein